MSSTQLTRKTFKSIAETVASLPVNSDGYVEQGDIVAALADYFETTNARFDRDRFFRACQPKSEPTPTAEFRSEIHDGVEVGIVSHNGHDYTALGSVVTPLQVTAYKAGDKLTTWAGETIGTCRVTSSWHTPRSYVSNRMFQLEAVVNGVRYTGRCAGDGMVFNGRRVAGQ